MQRETLELWRCCLSYGIDVAAADTVVLVARGQGWWPGLSITPPVAAAASAGAGAIAGAVDVRVGGGGSSAGGAGVVTGGDGSGLPGISEDGSAGAGAAGAAKSAPADGGSDVGGVSLPPRLTFYRALHQLACACVLPPGGSNSGSVGKRDEQISRVEGGRAEKAAEVLSLGGVAVVPESWADVGDTVDAAVEAAILWLLSGGGGSGAAKGGARTERTADRAVEVCSCDGMMARSVGWLVD